MDKLIYSCELSSRFPHGSQYIFIVYKKENNETLVATRRSATFDFNYKLLVGSFVRIHCKTIEKCFGSRIIFITLSQLLHLEVPTKNKVKCVGLHKSNGRFN